MAAGLPRKTTLHKMWSEARRGREAQGLPALQGEESAEKEGQTQHTTSMNEEQKRIKIAEACGMTGWQEARSLPDYFNDLNAVHEIEKMLNSKQESAYWEHLMQAHEYIQPWAGCATAAQRCEALGKTLNLW
jgi:hypothetical protein